MRSGSYDDSTNSLSYSGSLTLGTDLLALLERAWLSLGSTKVYETLSCLICNVGWDLCGVECALFFETMLRIVCYAQNRWINKSVRAFAETWGTLVLILWRIDIILKNGTSSALPEDNCRLTVIKRNTIYLGKHKALCVLLSDKEFIIFRMPSEEIKIAEQK